MLDVFLPPFAALAGVRWAVFCSWGCVGNTVCRPPYTHHSAYIAYAPPRRWTTDDACFFVLFFFLVSMQEMW